MEKTILTTQPCWNPFFMDGKEIQRIHLYKDGEVIVSTDWFGSGSNNDYKSVELPFPVKRSLKLNLNRTDAFFMNCKERYYEKRYEIYIHADLVGLECLGTETFVNTWHSTSTKENYSVSLHGTRRKYVKLETGMHTAVYEEGDYVQRFYGNVKFTDTKEGEKCKEIAKEWSKIARKDFNMFDVHEILERYEVSRICD